MYKVPDCMVKAIVSRQMADLSATYYEVFYDTSAYGFEFWLDYVDLLDLEPVAYSSNGRLFVSHKNGRLYGYYGQFMIAWTLYRSYFDRR